MIGYRSNQGFTLIELVMVIVIVGILAVIAIPRFDTFYAIKLDGAVKKVVSDIRYTQQLAIARHTNSRVIFYADENSYVVEQENPQGSDTWESATDPFSRADLSVDFDTDAQYKGINIQNNATFQFDWQGATDVGSVSLGYHGRVRIINVEANTGRVSVQ
jgi:prepilin-type N-terminal cleavage/methylation domain-containing protein